MLLLICVFKDPSMFLIIITLIYTLVGYGKAKINAYGWPPGIRSIIRVLVLREDWFSFSQQPSVNCSFIKRWNFVNFPSARWCVHGVYRRVLLSFMGAVSLPCLGAVSCFSGSYDLSATSSPMFSEGYESCWRCINRGLLKESYT